MTAVRTSRIAVDGIGLVVDQAGEGGRPLLLIHGFCGCRDDFTPVIPALVAAGWHVAAADNRGHGDSDQPSAEADYGVERFTADALGVADALGWDRFALLGHSLGGAVAQELVLRVPERVTSLVLMNTTPTALAVAPEQLAAAAAVVRADGLDRLIDLMNEHGDPLGSPAHERAAARIPGYRERGERNTRRCSGAMYARLMDEMAARHDASAALAGVGCPTLVVVGEEDQLMLGPSHRLAEVIPGARLVVIPAAGHSPQFETPEPFRAALLDFLATACAP
jgi:3-oxoadipate enol-lactonase